MQRDALTVSRNYEREAKERLRRISLVAAGLDIIGPKKHTPGLATGSSLDEAWYEENKGSSSHQGSVEATG